MNWKFLKHETQRKSVIITSRGCSCSRARSLFFPQFIRTRKHKMKMTHLQWCTGFPLFGVRFCSRFSWCEIISPLAWGMTDITAEGQLCGEQETKKNNISCLIRVNRQNDNIISVSWRNSCAKTIPPFRSLLTFSILQAIGRRVSHVRFNRFGHSHTQNPFNADSWSLSARCTRIWGFALHLFWFSIEWKSFIKNEIEIASEAHIRAIANCALKFRFSCQSFALPSLTIPRSHIECDVLTSE